MLPLFISPWINLILLEISVNRIKTKAPVIALEVCSDVAGPPFITSSLLADQDWCAGWRKWEEHISPPIPVQTSPDSVLAPCESPVLQVSWPFCNLSTYFLWISFLPIWVRVHFRSLNSLTLILCCLLPLSSLIFQKEVSSSHPGAVNFLLITRASPLPPSSLSQPLSCLWKQICLQTTLAIFRTLLTGQKLVLFFLFCVLV